MLRSMRATLPRLRQGTGKGSLSSCKNETTQKYEGENMPLEQLNMRLRGARNSGFVEIPCPMPNCASMFMNIVVSKALEGATYQTLQCPRCRTAYVSDPSLTKDVLLANIDKEL